MASEPEPVSSNPSAALEQVEKESIEKVKTIERNPIADDESPGLDVTSSGPEQNGDEDENQVVSDKESWNDHVAEVDKGNVSGLTDGDGIKDEAVEKPKDLETNKSQVAESEAEVNSIEPSEPLNTVAKEEVQVKDSSETNEVPNAEFEQSEPLSIPKEAVATEVIDVGKNEDFSEEKARVIEELQKESAEPEAADKIEVDATKDKEIRTDETEGIELKSKSEVEEPIEEAHVEQKDRDFPPEADEKLDNERSGGTEKLAVDEENEVKKEDTVVNEESAIGISDVAETEQTSREIALPVDLQGDKDETLPATDKDIGVEKKVDAEQPHKSETGSRVEDVGDELKESVGAEAEQKVTQVPTSEAAEIIDAEDPLDVETEDKEENVVVIDESSKGIKEDTNKTELPESKTEVNEAKLEVAKEKLEEIEPSESLDDAAKESSVPEASVVELEQSEAVIPKEAEVVEAKDLGNSAAKEVEKEDFSDEITDELKKESAETDVADEIEVDAAKEKESQADKVEGFELKSEAVVEPIVPTDESNVEQNDTDFPPEAAENIDTVSEAKGNSDVSEAQHTSRDIELPRDIEGKKDETLATTVENDKDIEVEKKIGAEEESLESETGTKGEDLSDENAEKTEESKELVAETESTENFDIDAAKDEAFLTEHKDTEAPTSEAEQNIDTQDPIKTEEENNSIETSAATDVKNEEKKEDAVVNEDSVVPEAKKNTEDTFPVLPITQDSDDVSKVIHTSREIQLPADLESKRDGTNIDIEEAQESKAGTVEEEEKTSESVEPQGDQQKEVEENVKLEAPTTEEAPKEEEVAPVKQQKQSNNLLSKVKQSLVKAKKAIIKKTPSKTPPTS